MNKENMGSIIAELRKEKNMTQQDLASRLNITDKAVSKWERGISCPDINTIPQLAEILGITPDKLLGYCEENYQGLIEENRVNQFGDKEDIKEIIQLIFKAVGMAMGIASLVLLILNRTPDRSILIMLALGLACLGISSLNQKKE